MSSEKQATVDCETLRRRSEFQTVYRYGNNFRTEGLVLLVLKRPGTTGCRSAVVASRKVGGAVRRNRAKRLMRVARRALQKRSQMNGVDVVIIARAGCPDSDGRTILSELTQLYQRAGLFCSDQGSMD